MLRMTTAAAVLYAGLARQLLVPLRAAGGVAACLLLLAAGQPAPVRASPDVAPPTVRVGVMASLPPLQLWPEAASAPSGADIDLLHAIEQPSGLRFEFARYTAYADLERDLLAGKVQVVTSMAYTPERAGSLRFTSPYYTVEQAIVARQDEGSAETASALFSRRQAVVPGFARETVGTQHFPLAPRVIEGSLEQALLAVQQGRADWVLDAEPVLRHLIERDRLAGLQVMRQFGFAEGQLRLAVRLEDAALAERLERALATLAPQQADNWVSDWTSRGLATMANGSGLQLTGVERARLAMVRPLRIGYFAGQRPFSDRRSDGNPEGLAIDLTRAMLDRLGLKVERWTPLTLAGMLDAARRGEIDLAVGLTDAPERRNFLRFIGPYYADPLVLISRRRAGAWSLPQLVGQRLALPAGHFLEGYLASQFPGIQVLGCERIAACLGMVESGRADATLGGLMASQSRLASGDYPHLLIAGALERMSNEHAIGVTRAHEAIAPLLRRALDEVQATELASLQRKWSPHQDPGLPWRQVLRWGLAALAAALLLLAGGIWHNRKLRRQVALRRAAQQQAEQERSAAERYLAFLAHEVRNSLHAVKAGVALLANEQARSRAPTPAELSEQRGTLNALRHSTGATLTLLNDLLDRHRLQAGGLSLTLKAEHLPDVLSAVTEELRPVATEKGLRLNAPTAPDLWLMMDALRVQQILRNLLVNAIKFTPVGVITVVCDVVQGTEGSVQVRLQVSDSGPGLPLAMLGAALAGPAAPRQPGRADATTTTTTVHPPLMQASDWGAETAPGDRPGSGLGLSLSRELAHLMGGEIRADNHMPPQRGASFCLAWRAPLAPRQVARNTATASRVLLVEDDPVYRMLLQHAFVQASVDVVPVSSLRQARSQLQRGRFDLVLCDAHLGDGGPADLLPELPDLAGAGLPLVVMSGHLDPATIAVLRGLGALDCLEKDADVSAMVRRVLAAAAESAPVNGR